MTTSQKSVATGISLWFIGSLVCADAISDPTSIPMAAFFYVIGFGFLVYALAKSK